MKNFKTAQEYIVKRAKKLSACSSEFNKAKNTKTLDDLIELIRDNAAWVVENNLLNDKSSLKCFGVKLLNVLNSGLENTGNRNSGNSNSGNSNSGNSNSGYNNSGNSNSGNRNSGDWNSGYSNNGNSNSGNSNSGYSNSGYSNSGNRNSGDWNSGNRNSGDWNSGNSNSGFFNSNTPEFVRVFDVQINREIWEKALKPSFVYNININLWVFFSNMSDDEKIKHKKAFVCDGYLKTITYKEAWKNAYDNASSEDILLLKNLPNWNADIFEEITGIKVK